MFGCVAKQAGIANLHLAKDGSLFPDTAMNLLYITYTQLVHTSDTVALDICKAYIYI